MSLLEKLNGPHCFQTFHDKAEKLRHLVATHHGSLEEHKERLVRLNKKDAGIFFTVNETEGTGRKAENIIKVRALYADFDNADPNRSFEYELPPSAIIESSPGKHHLYWLVDDFPLEEFTEYQSKLISLLDSDPKIKDLPRVMRVPGFYHNKAEPFMVRELPASGNKYTAEELKEWIDGTLELFGTPKKEKPVPKTEPRESAPIAYSDSAVRELKMLATQLEYAEEGARNDTLNRVAFQAYGISKAGRIHRSDVTKELEAAAILVGLSLDETRTTLKSARRKAVPVYDDLDMLPEIENTDAPPHTSEETGVDLVRGDMIKPGVIRWLWGGWLARGKMHIIGGSPGTGKTTICLSLAALLSSGGHWPDDTLCTPRKVVIWSGEDDPNDTLAPRLIKSGADMRNIYFINGFKEGGGKSRSFNPAKDMRDLRKKLLKLKNVGLLIVDPLVSAVSGDSHKNADVRDALQPLVDLASYVDCALVGITHLTKGTQGRDPIERLNGSVAFGALARLVFIAAKNTQEDTRVFLRAKSNIGPDEGGFEYSLHYGEVPGYTHIKSTNVIWNDAIEGDARCVLADADQTPEENEASSDAKLFITEFLEEGPRDVKSIRSESGKIGIKWETLKRIKKSIGAVSVRTELGMWQWKLKEKDHE